ncbi:MvaI/BcnI family restriction endonuclease [Croceicoccus sp. F390]|uniref:MvaI/BcnI family restriction endonuclease n=1 Tax=Croceicoccus esteveae TaxID=3075597 RepID=A0ABU2ZMA0_9SPHN|nr:MvaI/BcnI family restriction endonuclease [Croceicoccus sp. F390]MDT0576704.1 MvaI/BcnI family restriction endonuclease [Croceicoccus sp. F390]
MAGSLAQLLDLLRHHGATRIYAKRLAPNDNSKNQVYLGGDFSALNIIPHGEIYSDDTEVARAVRDRAKASVDFYWVNGDGLHHAPNTGLILYPKYPEVRMSGFLLGCKAAPSDIMRVRDEGRVLFFGITRTGSVVGYAVSGDDPVARELVAREWPMIGVFLELPLSLDDARDPREQLLDELRRIYRLNWIASQKLAADGTKAPYAARNGGGYTLEAELGVTPNGYAEPDYLGWEVKQYGVRDFLSFKAKSPVTLMTPEPTGGIYRTEGVDAFMRRFGYPDQSGKADRINFGGRYDCQRKHHLLTGLRMTLTGYDEITGKITDLDGELVLISDRDEVAATWSFKGMMAHWNRKHAQAAYVPSLFRTPPPEYCYGPEVLLCEETDFLMFLQSFARGQVYYDPAIKLVNASTMTPEIKRRSQFRVSHNDLTVLYRRSEKVSL